MAKMRNNHPLLNKRVSYLEIVLMLCKFIERYYLNNSFSMACSTCMFNLSFSR